jgi:uncharacterized membrane protein SpoIIM required for sporulation
MANLGILLDRTTIIALAFVGAAVALIGSALLRRPSRRGPRAARLFLVTGYGITIVSVALFIVAGFVGNR